MEEALRRHRERYAAGPLILSAQTQFEPFYRGFGFVATGSAYEDYGVAHVDMMLDAPAPERHAAEAEARSGPPKYNLNG